MKRICCLLVLAFGFLIYGGCAPYQQPSSTDNYSAHLFKNVDTSQAVYEDKNMMIKIHPNYLHEKRFSGFDLTVENKSKADLSINWDKSYFIDDGASDGGFMFKGVNYAKRTDPKPDLILLPGATKLITIYPNSRAQFLNSIYYGHVKMMQGGWANMPLGPGNYGAIIQVKGKGFDKQVKLFLSVSN